MRIKKITQGLLRGLILNTKSNSTDDTYSCSYVNSLTDNSFNATKYTNEEVKVGVWTNGKPIYRKVVEFTIDSSSLTTAYEHGIKNIDKVLPTSCATAYRTGVGDYPLSFIFPQDTTNLLNWAASFCFSSTQVFIYLGTTAREEFGGNKATVIMEYTKTTD